MSEVDKNNSMDSGDRADRLTEQWALSSESRAVFTEDNPSLGRLFTWLLLLCCLLGVLWSAWAEIDEVTRGIGKVVPSRQVQIVQNLEGGIIAEILVSEGQVVERNEVLLNIDATASTSSFRESRMHYLALKAKAARLKAEAEDTPCDPPPDVLREAPHLAEQEFKLHKAHKSEHDARIEVARQQMLQVKQELTELRAKRRQLDRSYELVKSELDMTEPLAGQGAVSQVELLRLRRQVNDIHGELESSRLAIPKLEAKLAESEHKAEEIMLQFRHEAREELNQVLADLERLQATNVALEDRMHRTKVRAPMHGTVKQLLVNTVGGVVGPGQHLVEIVPLEDTLLVEARITPADIAFLHPGQDAVVKFSAYDFAKYGGMEAELEHISADTISDDDGNDYYLVRVRTRASEFIARGENLPIIPGMTATVDILTGKKTILEYLLKPVLRAKEVAFTER